MAVMPAIFFGHGNPRNALLRNRYTERWSQIGATLPRPEASFACRRTGMFPVPRSRSIRLPTPSMISEASRANSMKCSIPHPAIPSLPVASRNHWLRCRSSSKNMGLDRGTWSVLSHVYPKADIPVVQLSIDETRPASFHDEIGQRLAPLREEGILIVGSGNLVHNLHTYAWGQHAVHPFAWVVRFEQEARGLLQAGDHRPLIHYESMGREAQLSIPTPDHHLPLLDVIGAR
jgi:4,5-DOPA dioxygenase extradiol